MCVHVCEFVCMCVCMCVVRARVHTVHTWRTTTYTRPILQQSQQPYKLPIPIHTPFPYQYIHTWRTTTYTLPILTQSQYQATATLTWGGEGRWGAWIQLSVTGSASHYFLWSKVMGKWCGRKKKGKTFQYSLLGLYRQCFPLFPKLPLCSAGTCLLHKFSKLKALVQLLE